MTEDQLRGILSSLQSGEIELQDCVNRLKELPYQDLGFARCDHHRQLRQGCPETIFCQGKTISQVLAIVENFKKNESSILGTRASREMLAAVAAHFPESVIHETAGCFALSQTQVNYQLGEVLVLTAGTADIPVAEEAAFTLETYGHPVNRIYDVGVAGIHRLFHKLEEIRKAKVIIVVAGMEGALASVVGGLVEAPVIAVPTSIGYGASFQGLSALLTMLNSCAAGVGVVNIDNGFGAARLAISINQTRGAK